MTNYSYVGDNLVLGGNVNLLNLGTFLSEIYFEVSDVGSIRTEVPESFIESFGESYSVISEILSRMTIKRLSNSLVVLDTFITIGDIDFDLTFYLNDTPTGYSCTFALNIEGYSGVLKFDLIKL
jgi:hypothetical protein